MYRAVEDQRWKVKRSSVKVWSLPRFGRRPALGFCSLLGTIFRPTCRQGLDLISAFLDRIQLLSHIDQYLLLGRYQGSKILQLRLKVFQLRFLRCDLGTQIIQLHLRGLTMVRHPLFQFPGLRHQGALDMTGAVPNPKDDFTHRRFPPPFGNSRLIPHRKAVRRSARPSD
jgi:hypothetical protein